MFFNGMTVILVEGFSSFEFLPGSPELSINFPFQNILLDILNWFLSIGNSASG
jgi:hypothetical protein